MALLVTRCSIRCTACVLFCVYPKARSELAMIMLHEFRAKDTHATVRKSWGSISIHTCENNRPFLLRMGAVYVVNKWSPFHPWVCSANV